MQAVRKQTVVGAGGVIEVHSPELPAPGTKAEVVILFEPTTLSPPSLSGMFGVARGLYRTPGEADAFLREERDAWES